MCHKVKECKVKDVAKHNDKTKTAQEIQLVLQGMGHLIQPHQCESMEWACWNQYHAGK